MSNATNKQSAPVIPNPKLKYGLGQQVPMTDGDATITGMEIHCRCYDGHYSAEWQYFLCIWDGTSWQHKCCVSEYEITLDLKLAGKPSWEPRDILRQEG